MAKKKPAPPVVVRELAVSASRRSSRPAKSRKQRDLDLAAAYRVVRESPYGQMVIADLMLTCSVFHDIEGVDPISVGRGLGRRSVALHITKMLGLRPEHFPDEAWRVAGTADEMMGFTA